MGNEAFDLLVGFDVKEPDLVVFGPCNDEPLLFTDNYFVDLLKRKSLILVEEKQTEIKMIQNGWH